MILLALIGTVWLFCCLVAVALCIAASRADQDLALLYAEGVPAEASADFVAGFAEPELAPRPTPAPRAAQRF